MFIFVLKAVELFWRMCYLAESPFAFFFLEEKIVSISFLHFGALGAQNRIRTTKM